MITLATLPQATAQEVFDQVKNHLLTQNAKSIMEGANGADGEGCAYRGVRGLKCAAGCLIGDDEYKLSFENRTWGNLLHEQNFPLHHEALIRRLQYIHDAKDVSNWPYELKELAQEFHLNY